jgi:tripartite-type tricarboxylate transporter receptor subunit TctC
MFRTVSALISVTLFMMAASIARADPVADFYRGKQIRIVIGYGTGGAYDAMARLLGQYLPNYMPGHPAVIVENMPGAGSLAAANYLYNIAPEDGTVIGTFSRDMPVLAVLGIDPNVRFDPRRFAWLGSPSSYANDAYLLWTFGRAN